MKADIEKKKEENLKKLIAKGAKSAPGQIHKSDAEEKAERRHELFGDLLTVFDAKMMYKSIRLLLSLPEPTVTDLKVNGQTVLSVSVNYNYAL